MTAMRELANSAARSAIDKHVRKHTGKQVTGKLFGGLSDGFHQPGPGLLGLARAVAAGNHWRCDRRLHRPVLDLGRDPPLFSLMRLNRPLEDQPAAESTAGEESTPA